MPVGESMRPGHPPCGLELRAPDNGRLMGRSWMRPSMRSRRRSPMRPWVLRPNADTITPHLADLRIPSRLLPDGRGKIHPSGSSRRHLGAIELPGSGLPGDARPPGAPSAAWVRAPAPAVRSALPSITSRPFRLEAGSIPRLTKRGKVPNIDRVFVGGRPLFVGGSREACGGGSREVRGRFAGGRFVLIRSFPEPDANPPGLAGVAFEKGRVGHTGLIVALEPETPGCWHSME
jgi:hypothetical protein